MGVLCTSMNFTETLHLRATSTTSQPIPRITTSLTTIKSVSTSRLTSTTTNKPTSTEKTSTTTNKPTSTEKTSTTTNKPTSRRTTRRASTSRSLATRRSIRAVSTSTPTPNPNLPEINQATVCPAPLMPEQNRFKCSMSTFKRLLRLMGYRFKKIDSRAAIMQRPELTRWRGIHLKRLRQNDESENPKMLVYIDETWVDSNARVAKGWQPRYFDKFRDMAAFSYDKHKVGRGIRLIVLAAVTKDGVIADSVKVFKVSASTTADDYHKNVGEAEFDRWIAELVVILDALGGNWLIIMDNASYHSAKAVPKSSARKQEVYDFIKAQIEANRYQKTLPPIKDTRLWDLQDMVREIVALPSMKNRIYKLDIRLAEKGHEIVRLPPYHCHLNPIEFVWKDVKHEVQKKNTEQKIDVIKPIVENELRTYGAAKVKPHWDHVINLRNKLWVEDGLYDAFIEPLVITDDDDYEEDDEDLFSEDEDEFENDDNIPYGEDTWYMDDGINMEGPQFVHENEIFDHMRHGPPPKRGRTVPE